MSLKNPVRQLNAETARKIAAGEVIERPSSIVRELMDNAIDSGAQSITVEINGGGIEKVRIVDDGSGMTKDDLSACARPHATSKITHEDDLMKLTTLGFRGEALASIAAVSRLSILSGGWKMRASITEDHIIEQAAPTKGTIVMSEGLFENFPARRVFLKRPQSEGVMCKNTFVEKAMAHPDRAFKFYNDGELKLDLRGNVSQKVRFIQALQLKESENLFYEIEINEGSDFSAKIIIGEPSICRNNKKDIYIFVNGRRIQEYSLVQAVEYGGQGFFPNGTYPVAGVFLKVNPKLVDFNIHPAKKEARFTDISEIHHAISTEVRKFLHEYTANAIKNKENYGIGATFLNDTGISKTAVQDSDRTEESYNPSFFDIPKANVTSNSVSSARKPFMGYAGAGTQHLGGGNSDYTSPRFYEEKKELSFTEKLAQEALGTFTENKAEGLGSTALASQEETASPKSVPMFTEEDMGKNGKKFHFLGSALGTFLVCEVDDTLYIIDKHAAHERILFDQIMEGDVGTVNLLIPYEIKTETMSQTAYLESMCDELTKFGFAIEKTGDYTFSVTTTPDRWKGNEKDLEQMLLEDRISPKELISKIAASTACKAAVKDGWVLEDVDAQDLAKKALTLPDPHCPHGRPVFYMLTKEKLFHLVRRTE